MGFPPLPGGPTADSSSPPQHWQPARWAEAWVLPKPPRSAWQRWGRAVTLFVVTVCSVFLAGALGFDEQRGLILLRPSEGVALAVGLLSILFAHEMGHYLACRYYRVDATLPHFIPSLWIPVAAGLAVWQPLSFVGTFGAFIRIRAPIPNRRALFDIGVAGPLAGFLVCLPVLVLGVLAGRVLPHQPAPLGGEFGEPLVFQWVSHAILGPIPPGSDLFITKLGEGAWFGLLVTALNLMPIGQLDGGHATYALLRARAHTISRLASWVCVALIYFGPSWILWSVLVRLLGRRHPPTLDDETPIGRGRVVVGLVTLLVFVVCFVPDPIVFSWRDLFHATGLDLALW